MFLAISVFDQMSIVTECIILYILGVIFGLLISFWFRMEAIPYIKSKKKNKNNDVDTEVDDE